MTTPPTPPSPEAFAAPAPDAKPWDRRPDEPLESYARFLVYRNLGPGRSLRCAYNTALRDAEGEAQAPQRARPVSGAWTADCTAFGWVERAALWDVERLTEQGAELAVLWVGILTTSAQRVLEALADPEFKPRSFAEVMDAIDRLARFVTPEFLQGVRERTEHDRTGAELDVEARVRRAAEVIAGAPTKADVK